LIAFISSSKCLSIALLPSLPLTATTRIARGLPSKAYPDGSGGREGRRERGGKAITYMNLLVRIERVVQGKVEIEGSDLVVVLVLTDQRPVVAGPGGKEEGEGGREGGVCE